MCNVKKKLSLPGLVLVREFKDMLELISFMNRYVNRFARTGLSILVSTFLARGFVNGFLVPYAVTYLVEGLKEYMEEGNGSSKVFSGTLFLGLSGAVFGLSELMLMMYFEKLSRGIVLLKEKMLLSLDSARVNDKENLVGVIANDVDFVIWNINGVLTTLLPNLFTAVTALVTVYGLGASVAPLLVVSLIPYLIYAEFYVRRVMRTRTFEREAYSYSIVLVRDYVYENIRREDLQRVLKRWKFYIDKIMWYDRLFFTAGLTTAFGSVALISYIVWLESMKKRISLGGVAGIISASLTSHMGMLNTIWAICLQGQVSATFKRLKQHISLIPTASSKSEPG